MNIHRISTKYMRSSIQTWRVNGVVDPTRRLLHTNVPPFWLSHKMTFLYELRNVWRKDDVPKYQNVQQIPELTYIDFIDLDDLKCRIGECTNLYS